jgi:hypothetical protein
MFEILRLLVREEWRRNSSLFGGPMFSLFPFLIALFTFGFAMFLPMFETIIPLGYIYLLINYIGLLCGVSVGAIAFMGREIMNRRFGQFGMVAYSSRTLPVSERRIFLNVILNEVIFYTILFGLPFFAGLSAASAFTLAMPVFHPLLVSSVFLSFLTGFSAALLLSTVYIRSSRVFSLGLLVIFIGMVAGGFAWSTDVFALLPSFTFFASPGLLSLAYSLVAILVPFSLSLVLLRVDYRERVRHVRNRISGLSDSLGRLFREPAFVSKDMLDLSRSEGGLGKVYFSLAFPLILIWAMLFIFSGLFSLPGSGVFLIFSVLVGALSSSMYNWLTEFDDFSMYSFLPVKVSDVMMSKLKGYVLLNVASLVIVIGAAVLGNALASIHYGIALFLSVSAYTVSVTMFLSGLRSNRIFSGRTFAAYLLMISPVMVLCILLSITYPLPLLALPFVLIPASVILVRRSFRKWDALKP